MEILNPTVVAYNWAYRKVGDKFLIPGDDGAVLHNRVWASFSRWKKYKTGRDGYRIRTKFVENEARGLLVERVE